MVGHFLTDTIKIIYDSGTILDFDILSNKKISLLISWRNFPPKPKTNHCDLIEIEAENIYWENISDLED